MSKANAVILLLGAAVGISSPAAAQFDHPPEMRKGGSVDRKFMSTARCLVDGQPSRAEHLLTAEPGSEAESKALLEIVRAAPFCAEDRSMTRAPTTTWRGAIAEAVYIHGSDRARPSSISVASGRPGWLASPGATLFAVAQCAVERAPIEADRLIRTKWRSAEEASAVGDLLPTLRACGNGAKANFDRVSIRGTIAEGLVRAQGAAEGNK
ncbi:MULTISPECIES: hypothetical protein [unclassified Sphingopyxis]|uniref:hypothetical protein n=1 Tax=unclassified Sphingopyxis TaxID=2614943 RepID=UPI0025E54948|nr:MULTISPECIES: hypothetical protein [unclassified Sphingopyxis]